MDSNKMYQCIFSDLDNTLLMPDKTISEKTAKVLKRLMKKGITVVPSTGRAFWSIPEEVLEFPGFRYAIASNGAVVYDIKEKKPIIQLTLEPEFASGLFELLKEEYVTYECFVKGQAYTGESYFQDPAVFGIPGDRERNYVQSTRIPVPDIREFILAHSGELDALDVILLPKDRERVMKLIQSHFHNIYITTSVEHLIEISHENSGKHKAMEALLELLGIPMEQSVAFGDGDNDKEMLLTAGLGVAVENATDSCKEAANIVIGESKEEAIADFLEALYSSTL